MREDGVLEFHGRKDRQIKHLGHRVELDCSVDKSLIGGVKVTVDGKVIDGSVKQRLHELKGAMYR